MKRIEFMGAPFDAVSMEESVQRILDWANNAGPGRTVITLNAGLLMGMKQDPALREACLNGDLILADGKPVVLASRLLGNPIGERVAGVDLMINTLAAGSQQGLKVYFLGARQSVLDQLHEVIAQRFPGIEIVGSRNGYFSEAEHADIIADINASGAQILYIGMPSPFKETWGEKHRQALQVPVIFGVGGSFDVLAGKIKRAPVWLQELCLEWAWRLAMEPRKMWKRYLVTNTAFLIELARLLVTRRPTQSHADEALKPDSATLTSRH